MKNEDLFIEKFHYFKENFQSHLHPGFSGIADSLQLNVLLM